MAAGYSGGVKTNGTWNVFKGSRSSRRAERGLDATPGVGGEGRRPAADAKRADETASRGRGARRVGTEHQVARGAVTLNGQPLWQGDGAAISAQPSLRLIGLEPADVLVFDLS